jgi:sugar/nucleoside kinase (ribokinase family)
MKILGMGNALVDIMTQLKDDSILKKFKFPKGSMTLVDNEMSNYLLNETIGLLKQKSSGGSAANTIHGLSHLGIDTAFIGKVGTDDLGKFFRKDMENSNIRPILFNSITDTGRVLAMISPDAERTMATYLGASIELDPQDFTSDIFKEFDFFYVEGYLVQNRELIHKALRLAKNTGLKTCLDLASFNVVQQNKDFLIETIREYVDIVFANEEEAKALTGRLPEEAVNRIGDICDIAVVKLGAKGSLVRSGGDLVKIEPISANCVDTTGAGDLYAAGFLYGIVNSLPISVSGKIGSLLAARVIENIGAKMEDSTWEQIRLEVKKTESE